jgi:hypothetical protein
MGEPHRDPRFTNSATYRIEVTVTVAGGARPATAHRRAVRVAERLANAAARAADVVDATVQFGPMSASGGPAWTDPVHFAAANTGPASNGEPPMLARYLDPDHERAIESLTAANATYRHRCDTDRERRLEVGCVNPNRALGHVAWRACWCVYCDPLRHLELAVHPADGPPVLCRCGTAVEDCRHHLGARLEVVDGDDPVLVELVELHRLGSQRGGGA